MPKGNEEIENMGCFEQIANDLKIWLILGVVAFIIVLACSGAGGLAGLAGGHSDLPDLPDEFSSLNDDEIQLAKQVAFSYLKILQSTSLFGQL